MFQLQMDHLNPAGWYSPRGESFHEMETCEQVDGAVDSRTPARCNPHATLACGDAGLRLTARETLLRRAIKSPDASVAGPALTSSAQRLGMARSSVGLSVSACCTSHARPVRTANSFRAVARASKKRRRRKGDPGNRPENGVRLPVGVGSTGWRRLRFKGVPRGCFASTGTIEDWYDLVRWAAKKGSNRGLPVYN